MDLNNKVLPPTKMFIALHTYIQTNIKNVFESQLATHFPQIINMQNNIPIK